MGVLGAAVFLGFTAPAQAKDFELTNVSYDPTRELYVAINKAFSAEYKAAHPGDTVTVKNSHGGSGRQAKGVIDGGKADVVTLALAADIDAIARAGLLAPDWQAKFPQNSTPYFSTIVFVVRKGNPKGIKDWSDLIKGDVKVISPDPKASGGARWNYLAAWGWALQQPGANEVSAKTFVKALYQHVPILDNGARAATLTFAQRGQGDVYLSWENEAYLTQKEFADQGFEIVAPPTSILAEPPVAIVDKNAAADGVTTVAKEYLDFLYTPQAQEIIAQNHYRPRNPDVLAKHKEILNIKLFTIDDVLGDGTPGSGWKVAQPKHFADGGIFDQIIKK
jgi:sulfate/thiosulfate transport system substrate-binding protein